MTFRRQLIAANVILYVYCNFTMEQNNAIKVLLFASFFVIAAVAHLFFQTINKADSFLISHCILWYFTRTGELCD